jgi:Subtilase family
MRLPTAVLLALALLISALPAAAADQPHWNPKDAGVLRVSNRLSDLPPTKQATGKLDSTLADLAETATSSRSKALDKARKAGLRTDEGGVHALLTVQPGKLAEVKKAVPRAGGRVTRSGNGGRYVQAFLPPDSLRELENEGSILSFERPPAFEPVAGAQLTQGDAKLNGPAWRNAGATGTGVKVGIIDVGFQGYPALLGTDLPASVTVRNFVDGETQSNVNLTTKHGTACAEIIHDIAPGAQLYLAKVGTLLDIEEAANWLQAQGVRVISSSIGIYNVSPGDGSGYLENVIAAKRAAGITWFTAAGNDRQSHWGGPANVGADGLHLFDQPSGQNVNYFGPGDGDAYSIPSGYQIQVHVRWSDWTNVDQDYDVFLVRWSGSSWQAMSQSGGTNLQSGVVGQRPVETATATTSGSSTAYGWVVDRHAGNKPVDFEMFAPLAPIDRQVPERSLANLADASSAVTVAAVDVGSFAQEDYSSEGPTNGPGGTASGGQTKPDISAYANVNTVSYGTDPMYVFNGTSAATPHVAGAAALVRQAKPSYTPDQLETFLANRAKDLGSAGLDNAFGYGRVHLGSAPTLTDTTAPSVTAPNANFRSNVAVGTSSTPVKLRVSFTASDASGIGSTRLQQKIGSAAYANVSLPSAKAVSADLSVGTSSTTTRRYRARATDSVGNTSAYATAPALKVRAYQNGSSAIVQAGSWTNHSLSKYYGGSVRHASGTGRRQSLTTSMHDVALVATRGPNRGKARVYVDGVSVATVDLYNSTTQYRRVVWARDFGSSGTHTVELRVLGTKNASSSDKRVDFDAFLVMKP